MKHPDAFPLLRLLLVALAAFLTPAPDAFSAAGGAKAPQTPSHTFAIGKDAFLLNGNPLQIRCGEVHAARVPREYWRHRLQMVRAMGLNTVCAYLFWNQHEPEPGRFDWSGQADAAAFIRMAQEEGLWVILRPGPYSCAEWEMGGMPWWLLRDPQMKLRSRYPGFMEPARRYLKEVGRVLGPLQVTRGGPILMVQVENEYGFYGDDAEYLGELRSSLLEAGIDVPLFACNPVQHLRRGLRQDLFQVVNFGSDPEGGFKALRAIQPQGPLMCGEFYPGWFDTWGQPHHTGNTDKYLADLETMLKAGASFSIYMAHGGTTFGLWSGTDRPFKPDTSSYDYDAPISEAGWITEKFRRTRELMSRYLQPGETLPPPPPALPVAAFPATRASGFAPLFASLPAPIERDKAPTLEEIGQGFGCTLYRTTLPAGPAGTLSVKAAHDFAFVFLDGKRIGVMDRRQQVFRVEVPARAAAARLDLLVEPMGRINFGPESHDRKGLHGPVVFTPSASSSNASPSELTGWKVYPFMHDAALLGSLRFGAAPNASQTSVAAAGVQASNREVPPVGTARTQPAGEPGFWRIQIDITKPADTFLDVSSWGKGVAWLNGRCLGRFWNIGPTQTMFAPGAWQKEGANELIILDLLGPTDPHLSGLDKPILGTLRPELDFAPARRPKVSLRLEGSRAAHEAAFAPGAALQEVRFSAPVTGRHFVLEALDAHDGKAHAAIAELDLLGPDLQPLSHDGWTVAYVDSEEFAKSDGTAENAIDGQTANHWHTRWTGGTDPWPHRLVLDLGTSRTLTGFLYVPRQGGANAPGRIKNFRIFVGDSLIIRAQ